MRYRWDEKVIDEKEGFHHGKTEIVYSNVVELTTNTDNSVDEFQKHTEFKVDRVHDTSFHPHTFLDETKLSYGDRKLSSDFMRQGE